MHYLSDDVSDYRSDYLLLSFQVVPNRIFSMAIHPGSEKVSYHIVRSLLIEIPLIFMLSHGPGLPDAGSEVQT
jgi:hypothetical protein